MSPPQRSAAARNDAGQAMQEKYYKAVRTAQSLFPSLVDHKYQVQKMYRRARRRPFEPDFLALRYLTPADHHLFVDVGANRGQSIDAILLTTQRGKVWSFEPNPLLAARLIDDYAHDRRVKVWPFALGEQRMTRTLHVPAYRGFVYDGLASLDEEHAVSWLRDRVYGYKASQLTVESFPCETRMLDSLHCDPVFIKIDVQGFELDVVLGARETIGRNQPIVLVEAPDQRLSGQLESMGLERYAFEGDQFARDRTGTLNTFFISARRREELAEGGASFS